MSFKRKMENGDYKISVVVVGDSKIGKTALIRQLMGGAFPKVRTFCCIRMYLRTYFV